MHDTQPGDRILIQPQYWYQEEQVIEVRTPIPSQEKPISDQEERGLLPNPRTHTNTSTTGQIPQGMVWLEGDNPFNSTDSRSYGPVPLALVRGLVSFKVRPHSNQPPHTPPPYS